MEPIDHVQTDGAPGFDELPISQGTVHDGVVYTAGQTGKDPETGELAGEDARAQTVQILENLDAILAAAGSDFEHVLKTVIYITDIDQFETVNEVYEDHMSAPYPARSAVTVADLAADATVEIEMIAAVDE
jgi:2-iminobutanoate/2-iminopropanoate deaminase